MFLGLCGMCVYMPCFFTKVSLNLSGSGIFGTEENLIAQKLCRGITKEIRAFTRPSGSPYLELSYVKTTAALQDFKNESDQTSSWSAMFVEHMLCVCTESVKNMKRKHQPWATHRPGEKHA